MPCLLTTAVAAVVLTSTIAVPQHPPLPPRQSALQKHMFESLWPQAHAASEVNFGRLFLSSSLVVTRTNTPKHTIIILSILQPCCAQYIPSSL
jgi:hypothetical protein